MDRPPDGEDSTGNLLAQEQPKLPEQTPVETDANYQDNGTNLGSKKYQNKHMKMFPELYRSDVSIYPSYTDFKLPYSVICRRRAAKKKKIMTRQLNWEILHIAMMQSCALSGVRVDRIFSIGFPPKSTHVKNGYIRRVTDEEVNTLALEIAGTNVATCYIFAPKDPKNVLAINLPFLIMVIKNMKKYFTFEITVLDDKRMHRRFRISNFQSTTKVRPFCTTMPIGLAGGWNQIQFNLADFTRRAYGSNYIETTRMQVHANCRIRRIYFADRLYTEDELPADYKLLFPERRESGARGSSFQDKKPGRKSQGRISVGAAPPDEAPAFRGESEKLDEERDRRRTTPVASVEPSRTIVAPVGASRVQIEIEPLESEGEETTEHEMEPESELEEATIEEHAEQPQETAVVEEPEPAVPEHVEEHDEPETEAEEEEREEEEKEEREETIATGTEDENEDASEQE